MSSPATQQSRRPAWWLAGLFLAMPLMAAIKAICLHVEDWNAWGQLMSSSPEIVPLRAGETEVTSEELTGGR